MKNNQFLFFCSNFHSRDVSELWNIFFMEFTTQNPDSLSHFMFVNESGLDNISAVSEFTIAQIAIEDKLKQTEISDDEYKKISKFVDKHFLGALRTQLDWNKLSVLNDKEYSFDNRIVHLVKFFMDYVSNNDIKVVCIDFVTTPTSLECRVLEKVCDEMNIKKLVSVQAAMYGRFEIFDNSKSISRVADGIFKNLLDSPMTKNELEKLDHFLETYKMRKKRFHGDFWLDKIENKSSHAKDSVKKIVKSFYNILTQKGSDKINIKHKELKEFLDKPYFVFLPNKKNNHRTYNASPFHSDYAALIKAISISLPVGYSLLIKDHPHHIRKKPNNNLIKAIMSTDNCHYLSLRTDYYDLLENAKGIFASSSTSSMECLMAKKHVIVFGSESWIFGTNLLAPVHRVSNLEKLPSIINNCISTPVEKDKINAYLFSLISSSSSIEKSDEESDFKSSQPDDKQKEYVHIVKMINNLIQ